MNRSDVEFQSNGTLCRAWHYHPASDDFTGPNGAPCVVMAHGFGGTRNAGLEPYAEAFSNAGLNVLLFDYRYFGDSDGEPRQLLSVSRQLEDWAAAIGCARALDGVDAQRVALWGSSFSGGHVIVAAARDGNIDAVTSQGPMMDGLAALTNIIGYAGIGQALKMTWAGLRDLGRSLSGRDPYRIPIIAEPGGFAAMTSHDALSGFGAILPEGWRNEFCARAGLTLGLYRPIRQVPKLNCPTLVQVCDRDSVAPADAAAKAGDLNELVEVVHYDIGHFDIYIGEGFKRSSQDQLKFYREHLMGSK
ncbi:hypothetical protein PC39_06259 [Salinisphaera sp. PC39]|uniref:alpha/beta hydrolase n=1 Tax=Salinisphaera sp. PC39 TaxID=1304156 RepID=UPI00333F0B29